MATTGEIAFTAASTANDAGTGHIDEAWVNPTNALDSNDTYAAVTAATFDNGDQTAILRTYNASAALTAAIPSAATIDGVIIRINGYSDHLTLVSFDLVQLLDATGALSGTNLAATPVSMGTDTAAIFAFGSSTEKWGLGAGLTRALLIDTEFGVGIGVIANTNNSQAFIDYVTIEVFYTVPASQTSVARISLASIPTPADNTNHSIKVRARTTSGAGTIRAALYEGASNRSGDLESAALTTSLADYTLAISEANAANITDYSDLEIRLWGYAAGGGAIVFEVDQLWLEAPAAGTSSTAVAEVSLAPGSEPTTRTGHSLKIRARTTAGAGTMRVALYEGATNITDTAPGYLETGALTTSLADYTLAIADADAAAITSYADLGVRFWGYAAAGGAIVFEVDQMWLEIPAAAVVAYVPRHGFVNYQDPGVF